MSFNYILSNWHVKYFEGDNESSLKDDHYEISVQNESNSQKNFASDEILINMLKTFYFDFQNKLRMELEFLQEDY